jgi:hypothetical protein
MNNQYKYAYIAFKTEGEVSAIFHAVGFPERPMAVDLENFVVDVKVNENIGLMGKEFSVALLNHKTDMEVMNILSL